MLSIVICLVAIGAGAAIPPGRYAISLEQVSRAVLAEHPEFAGDTIELAAPIEARQHEPQLSAGPVEQQGAALSGWSSAIAHLRLHCSSEQVCLPFYAIVYRPGREENVGRPANAASQNDAVMRRASQQSVSQLDREEAPGGVPTSVATINLRSGSRVLLVIDNGKLHLRLPAVCLQSGTAGTTIRVRAAGQHSNVYQAEVIDQHTVRGSL